MYTGEGKDYRVALCINKSHSMALSTEPNIIGLNHTLQELIIQLALYKLGNPRETTQKHRIVHTSYWYRTTRKGKWYSTTQKHSVICTDVVELGLPVAETIVCALY